MNFIKTLTADNTTAELACESRGVTRSQMLADVEKKQRITRGVYWEHLQTLLTKAALSLTFGTHGHHEVCN